MKRLAVQIHLWLGLTLGLLWAVQGLTGAGLVFHRELDRWANPERVGTTGPMLPLAQLAAGVERAVGAAPKRISLADGGGDLLIADYEAADGAQRTLFLDAATGAVVDARAYKPMLPEDGATSRFLYNLHEYLLGGDTGQIFVGVSGVVLLTSVLLGLWIAWPRIWRGVTNIGAWRSRAQKLYGWHRMVGLATALALVPIAVGGVYMIWAEPIRGALADKTAHRLPYKAAPLAAAPLAWTSPDAALAAAQARFPDAAFVRWTPPSAKAPVHMIRLHQPDEIRAWSGTTAVAVDAVTGRVADVYDPLSAPLSNRVVDAAFAIHNGEAGGTVGRVLVMLAGLSLPMFYVTGVWLWLAKRRRRVAPALAPAA